jgi:hypothetical protein
VPQAEDRQQAQKSVGLPHPEPQPDQATRAVRVRIDHPGWPIRRDQVHAACEHRKRGVCFPGDLDIEPTAVLTDVGDRTFDLQTGCSEQISTPPRIVGPQEPTPRGDSPGAVRWRDHLEIGALQKDSAVIR